MLGILACPETGGDTVVADMAEAYKRLSPAFQGMIDQLQAVHSSAKMINHTKAIKGPGSVRSNPVESVHPIVRIHPVTGQKCIFYNSEFTTEVIGLKDLEVRLLILSLAYSLLICIIVAMHSEVHH